MIIFYICVLITSLITIGYIRLVIAEKKDYNESGTKEFDRMAFKYLGMACFPLAFCYCIYR